jgi:tetratricopeptide (TPR) repeat protein
MGLSTTWLALGDAPKALGYAERCIALAEETATKRYVSKGRRGRAEALLALGRLNEAADDVATALSIAEQIQGPESIWRALATSASVFAAQGLTEQAHAVARRALDKVEEIAANLKEPGAAEVLRSSRDVERLRTSAS